MPLPIITYTNRKCADIWHIYLDLIKQFYGKSSHTMLTDTFPSPLPDIDFFTYSKSDPFYNVWLRYLPSYHSEFFLYMQEDFFLHKPVNKNLLNFYLGVLKENSEVSCIRLIKSGINSDVPAEGIPTLHYVNYHTDYAFSMQPTIWRTKDFLKLQETKIQISPWDENKLDGNVLIKLDLVSLYHYNDEPKRGIAHYDSDVFPYIATALVKGKWNTKEYPMLTDILKQYGIDKTIRGEYE